MNSGLELFWLSWWSFLTPGILRPVLGALMPSASSTILLLTQNRNALSRESTNRDQRAGNSSRRTAELWNMSSNRQ